jgi:hypothetical protein
MPKYEHGRITLYHNDGVHEPQSGRLCILDIREGTSLKEKVAAQLTGGREEDTITIALAQTMRLFLLNGTPVDYVSYLRDGDAVVVALEGENFKASGGSLSGLPVTATGSAEEVAPEEVAPTVTEEVWPRIVTVSFFVNNIKKIDVIEGTVEFDFQLYLSWTDPKLAGIAVKDRPPYEGEGACWNPEVCFCLVSSALFLTSGFLLLLLPSVFSSCKCNCVLLLPHIRLRSIIMSASKRCGPCIRLPIKALKMVELFGVHAIAV